MSVYIPVAVERRIRLRFESACAYCHTSEFLTATTFEYEHITPVSAGGETIFENLCLACPTCNRFKADRVQAWDVVSQADAELFHPQQNRWRDHFIWNEGYTELIGITSVGRATISLLKMNRPALIRLRAMWVVMDEHPPQFDVESSA
jgi:hypothetical protein